MQGCASHSLRLLLFSDSQSEVKHALREFARSALKKVRRVVGPPPVSAPVPLPNRKKFAHDPIAGHTATLQLRSVGAARPSNEVAERLIRAYHRSSEYTPPPSFSAGEDLWTRIVNVEFADLLRILAARDASGLAEFIFRFGDKSTWFGCLNFAIDGYTDSSSSAADVALLYYDKLVCLGEAVGILQFENPEQGQVRNLQRDVKQIVSELETTLGITIAPPAGALHMVGLEIGSGGVLHYRHINALYVAWCISSLVNRTTPLCEYGGGVGAVAYYARRFGFSDYTLFDVPLTNLFSANFLIHALGADAVSLDGEEAAAATVKILPHWECTEVPDKRFGLSLNQDSFPEVDPAIVGQFVNQIARTTREYFLSINQEAEAEMTPTRRQLNVSKLLGADPAFCRLHRSRYWIREGYVEELYRIVASS